MKKIIAAVLFLASLVSVNAKAQTTQLKGVVFGGASSGLGYSFGPNVGVGLEIQKGKFELQNYDSADFSPKLETGNGLTITTQARPIFYFSNTFGLSAYIGGSYLLTSQFSKDAATLGGGLVYRPWSNVVFYGDYIQQFQPKITDGIEANYLKGAQITADILLKPYLKLRYTYIIAHGYDEGNPVCDGTNGPVKPGCERKSFINGEFSGKIMFLF